MKTYMVVAGEKALQSYVLGERDQQVLKNLGICRVYQFETEGEANAFKSGFLLALKLIEPIIEEVNNP